MTMIIVTAEIRNPSCSGPMSTLRTARGIRARTYYARLGLAAVADELGGEQRGLLGGGLRRGLVGLLLGREPGDEQPVAQRRAGLAVDLVAAGDGRGRRLRRLRVGRDDRERRRLRVARRRRLRLDGSSRHAGRLVGDAVRGGAACGRSSGGRR